MHQTNKPADDDTSHGNTTYAKVEYIDVGSLSPDDSVLVGPWDANVEFRGDELANKGDAAYRALTSLILDLLSECISAGERVLDAGCGLGYLAASMAAAGYQVEGVDASRLSIDYAKKRFSTTRFHAQTIEQFATRPNRVGRKDAVVANMVLHTTPRLDTFITSVVKVLKPGGTFIASIPHPCFFLGTKDSLSIPFSYSVCRGFLIPFRIHGGRTHPELVPYFQRTVGAYTEALYKAGLTDLRIREPQYVGEGREHDILAIFASRK